MSTNLEAISNTSLEKFPKRKDWDKLLEGLKTLNLNNPEFHEKGIEWSYDVFKPQNLDEDFYVDFSGPTMYCIYLFEDICIIGSFYRYWYLYHQYEGDIREDFYKIIKLFGGTEVIYLADNGCNPLSTYLEVYAFENTPYETLKKMMIKEMGEPLRHARDLTDKENLYRNIDEFLLETFDDLKRKR